MTAWRGFSAAFREFPYHGGLVYSGPQQLGPANLLWAESTGFAATMVGFPYDDLNGWRAIYPPEIFVQQFEKVADGFDRALAELGATLARLTGEGDSAQGQGTTPAHRRALAEEYCVGEAAAIHFRSSANQARFVLARQALAAARNMDDAVPHRAAMDKVLQDEIVLARRLHAIQSRDSRIGFEASNQYYYVPVDLMEKVLNCRNLLAHAVPK